MGGIPLSPHKNNRLIRMKGELQEPSRLLNGVGAMGDDDADHVLACEGLLDPCMQFPPLRRPYLIGGKIKKIVNLDSYGQQSREPVQQRATVQLRDGGLALGIRLHGDGAPSGDELDVALVTSVSGHKYCKKLASFYNAY